MKRGEIWTVGLDSLEGHEQKRRRPVLIVSPDAFNRVTRVPVVLPITSGGSSARTAGFVERLAEHAEADVQRIGLSATVGNPEVLAQWLGGSSRRPGRVVHPAGAKAPRLIEIHPLDADDDPSLLAARLVRGSKALLFAESRGKSDRMKTALTERGVRAFVHHSSVSRAVREETEDAFRGEAPCCIVCTSSLELGIDVGDLDLVLQWGAPATVSSFLQRLGRTGRRPGTRGHIAFLTDDQWGFLQAVSIVSLALKGRVEPVSPCRRSPHVFVHQIMARVLQGSGVTRGRLVAGVGLPWCFADLAGEEREAIIDHLLEKDILTRAGALLTFGAEGEKVFGRGNFRKLYSVFDTPRELVVRTTKNREIGTLDSWFVQSFGEGEFVFVLGGEAWEVVQCDWERGVLLVREAPRGKIPTWSGGPRLLSRAVCEEMRALLLESDLVPFLGQRAQQALDRLRAQWGSLLSGGRVVIQREGNVAVVHTFAGGRINNVLGRLLELEHAGAACGDEAGAPHPGTGRKAVVSNLAVQWPIPASGPFDCEILATLDRLAHADSLSSECISALVRLLPRGRLSKFQPYLPPALEEQFIASRLFDGAGACALADTSRVSVTV